MSVHREYCDCTSTEVLCVVIVKWTVITTAWIYFDTMCTSVKHRALLNVHKYCTCTIPRVHACKSNDAIAVSVPVFLLLSL